MAKKQTSEAVSKLASEYLKMTNGEFNGRLRSKGFIHVLTEIKQLAGSALTQDESPRKIGKAKELGMPYGRDE